MACFAGLAKKWSNLCWRHQMEPFSAILALCEGNPPVAGGFPHKGQWSPVAGVFPHKGQWCGTLIFSLICVWTNGSANNRDAGDLRRHRTHYDVTVIRSINGVPDTERWNMWHMWVRSRTWFTLHSAWCGCQKLLSVGHNSHANQNFTAW